MWNLLEQPWTLLAGAVLVLLAVLTFRSVWDERRKWWQWLLPLGVAVLAFGLDFAVATDLEKIHAVIRTGIEAAESENCPGLARLIAQDYEDSYHKSRQALLSRCRDRLRPPAIESIRRVDSIVEIAAPEATATFTIWVRFEEGSFWAQSYKANALVKIQFYFRRQPNGTWLVHRTEVLEVDKMPVSWRMARS